MKIGVLFFILTVKFTLQVNYSELIQNLSTFFIQRHVHSITAATCWPSEANQQLFWNFSKIDKSLTFNLIKSEAHSTWYKHGFIIDLSCDKSLNFIHKVSNVRMFNVQNDWVFLNSKSMSNVKDVLLSVRSTFESYLNESYVLPDSGVFLLQKIGSSVWEIWSGFRITKSSTIQVFKTGLVTQNRLEINSSATHRTNFQSVELKATTVIFNSDNFFGFGETATSKGLDVFSHIHYPIVKILADQLNFKMSMRIINDHGWIDDNGSFSGLIGNLQREEIDFGATGTLMRADRMSAADFTVGIVSIESNILFKRPKLSYITNIHTHPFTYEVWLTILFTSIVFISVLTFLNKFKINYRLTVPDIIALVYGAICQQGSTAVFNMVSIKIVLFVLFLTALFLLNAYSAMIVNLLQSDSDSIKDVRDVLFEKKMSISVQNTPYGRPYFNETTDHTIQMLYQSKLLPFKNAAFTNLSTGIDRIRTELHGFMVEKISAYQYINENWREEERCELSEVQMLRLPLLAIPIVKKSGHKDVFKQKLIQQLETGIIRRIIKRWTPNKPTCDSAKKKRQYVSVSIDEILPTLKLLGYGMLISVVVLVVELAHDSRITKKHR